MAATQAASDGTPPAGDETAPQTETEAETSFWDRFQDPVDGRFDVTAGGDGGSGLIPLIIPFNDPAVGAGAVAGIVYFHPDEDEATPQPPSNAPPTTSFAGAARSDNDSWVFAGGHSRGFNNDRIRYLGAVGKASVNLDFYGIGETPILNDNPLSFNLDGSMLMQQLQFQLGQTRAAAGFRFTYINATTTFDDIPPELVQGIGGTKDAGLGVFAEWDTRDTTFTPSSGVSLLGRLSMFSEALGGDQDYAKFTLASRTYWPFRNERLIFGLRADYNFVGGDAPFYALPFLSLRGVPAFRYLGNHTVTVEVEPRWKIDDRWSLARLRRRRSSREGCKRARRGRRRVQLRRRVSLSARAAARPRRRRRSRGRARGVRHRVDVRERVGVLTLHCAGIVITGAARSGDVSASVKSSMISAKIRLDAKSPSST